MMKRLLLILLFILGIFSKESALLYSQSDYEKNTIQFLNGNFVPDNNIENLNSDYFDQALFDGKYYVLVRFNSIPGQYELTQIASNGIHLLEYIPNNAYFASIPKEKLNKTLREFDILSVSLINSRFKIDKRLNGKIPSYAINKEGYADISISYFKDISTNVIINDIKKYNLELLAFNDRFQRMKLRVPEEEITNIANLAWVMWLEPVHPPVTSLNLPGKTNNKSNVLGANYKGARGLTGKSIRIGEWDSGPVGNHIDFDFRLKNKEIDSSVTNHATHVAGTMAGAGLLDPYSKGMAPQARIFSWDFFGDIPHEMDSSALYDGIMITQNSYAYDPDEDTCEIRGAYDIISRDLDELTYQHAHLINVFAAGNFQSQCGQGGYKTVSGGFQSAKNNITVGAVRFTDQMSGFSSWGPVKDGRLKPEICATGVGVMSTLPNNNYSGSTWKGTSMACPAASGVIAQLYQRYRQLQHSNPKSATIKAIVCNTADDLGTVGPDYKFGFGRINGYRAVEALEENRYIEDIVTDSIANDYLIVVPANVNSLKVLICWNDLKATPNSAKALINDLDLEVEDTTASLYYPKVLDPNNPTYVAIDGIDTLNNIEQVIIDYPAPGTYTIRVKGTSIPFGVQEYTMTYEFITNHVKVTYPIGGESLVPYETEYIRWDANGNTGNFRVEFSFDHGFNWLTIDSSVNSNIRYLEWIVPDTISGFYLIRVTSGNSLSGRSDTLFSIMYKPDTLIATPCDQQIHLAWNNVSTAGNYDIFMVDSGQWNLIGNTSDTFFTVQGLDNNENYWFSVSAKSVYIATGQKINAINASPDSSIIPPTVLLDPFMDTICENSLGFSKSTASGTEPIYQQWQTSIDNGTSWQDYSGKTDSFLLIPIVSSSFDGLQLRSYFYNSCMTRIYSNSATINVDTGYSIFHQPDSLTTCIGDTVEFSIGITGTPRYSIQWQIKADSSYIWSDIPGAHDTFLVLDSVQYPQNNYQYRAKITSKCQAIEYSDSVSLIIRSELSVNLSSDKDTVCTGDAVELIAFGSGGDTSNYLFSWNVATITLPTIYDTPSVTTIYIVNLYDNCSFISPSDSKTVYVLEVNSDWTYTPDWLSVDFTPDDTGKTSYFWSFGDGANSNDNAPNHEYTSEGTYNVCLEVTDYFGCSSMTCQDISVQETGIQDYLNSSFFNLIPNPSTGRFRLEINSNDWKEGSVTIYSMLSRSIIHKQNLRYPENSLILNLSRENTGIYLMEVRLDNKVFIDKLLIQ